MSFSFPKPVWLGKTVYLVTIGERFSFHGDWVDALAEFGKGFDPDERCAIWECQMGQDPVDATPPLPGADAIALSGMVA